VLTVFGFCDYHAKEEKERFRIILRRPSYQIWLNVGLALFCFGIMGSSRAWWESILWASLGVMSSIRAGRLYGIKIRMLSRWKDKLLKHAEVIFSRDNKHTK